jgi:hypothetical protein
MLCWRIAILINAAIAISYLDRQTLPMGLEEVVFHRVHGFLETEPCLNSGGR